MDYRLRQRQWALSSDRFCESELAAGQVERAKRVWTSTTPDTGCWGSSSFSVATGTTTIIIITAPEEKFSTLLIPVPVLSIEAVNAFIVF